MATKYIGVLNLDLPADTDWHDLVSDDFYDQQDGAAAPANLPAGLSFGAVTWLNTSANAGIYMLGAAEAGPASVTHKMPLLANSNTATSDLRAVGSRFRTRTVAYQKGANADALTVVAEFWCD